MFGTLRSRILVILAVVAFAAGALLVNGITLGLDLRGGMHLALEISDPDGTISPELKREYIVQNEQILRNRIDQFGVTEPTVQRVGEERIIVQLPGIQDEERAKAIIEQQAYLEWRLVRPADQFVAVLPRIDRAIAAALPDLELDLDTMATGVTPAAPTPRSVQDMLFGRDSAAAADSVAADSAAGGPGVRPLSSLLFASGGPGEFLVEQPDVERVRQYLAIPGVMELLPRNSDLKWSADVRGEGATLYRPLYFLEGEAFITGDRLVEAIAGRDPQFNNTIVSFTLDRRGGSVFDDVTAANIGNHIAIILDGQVHSAPEIRGRIGARGQIDMGSGDMAEAQDLALVLRAGAMVAPLEIVEQRSVGPSLGQDSIDQGRIAGIIGIVLVILIMVGYYRVAGFMAIAALSIYLVLLLGGLAALGATLTAPGIAGIILSLGMAVDANVLIFERVREELALGRTVRAAVDAGFQHAMSAIVDSNITTLITALILFQVGTGPVRGFAVTLSIGILASFFTAVFITRTFFMIYLDRRRPADAISI